jgi:hypothetical protein
MEFEGTTYLIIVGAAAVCVAAWLITWVLKMHKRAEGFVVDDVMSSKHESEVEHSLDTTFDELVEDVDSLDT